MPLLQRETSGGSHKVQSLYFGAAGSVTRPHPPAQNWSHLRCSPNSLNRNASPNPPSEDFPREFSQEQGRGRSVLTLSLLEGQRDGGQGFGGAVGGEGDF